MPVTTLKAVKLFDTPKVMAGPLDAIVDDIMVKLPEQNGDTEAAITIRQAAVDMLTAWKTGLVAPKLRLIKAPAHPGLDTAYSDIAEPTGSWYTAVAAVMGAVFRTSDNNVATQSQDKQWQYSGTDPAETIIGIALTDTV